MFAITVIVATRVISSEGSPSTPAANVTASRPSPKPHTVKLAPAVSHAALRFVRTAVMRAHASRAALLEGWRLTGPPLKQGTSLHEWLQGTSLVTPFPDSTIAPRLRIRTLLRQRCAARACAVPEGQDHGAARGLHDRPAPLRHRIRTRAGSSTPGRRVDRRPCPVPRVRATRYSLMYGRYRSPMAAPRRRALLALQAVVLVAVALAATAGLGERRGPRRRHRSRHSFRRSTEARSISSPRLPASRSIRRSLVIPRPSGSRS